MPLLLLLFALLLLLFMLGLLLKLGEAAGDPE